MKIERKIDNSIIQFEDYLSGIKVPLSKDLSRSFVYKPIIPESKIWYFIRHNIPLWYNNSRQTGKTTFFIILANYLSRELGKKVYYVTRDENTRQNCEELSDGIIRLSNYTVMDRATKMYPRFMTSCELVKEFDESPYFYNEDYIDQNHIDYIFIDEFEFLSNFDDVTDNLKSLLKYDKVGIVAFSTISDNKDVLKYFLANSFEWSGNYFERMDIFHAMHPKKKHYFDKFAHIKMMRLLEDDDLENYEYIGETMWNKEYLCKRVWEDKNESN